MLDIQAFFNTFKITKTCNLTKPCFMRLFVLVDALLSTFSQCTKEKEPDVFLWYQDMFSILQHMWTSKEKRCMQGGHFCHFSFFMYYTYYMYKPTIGIEVHAELKTKTKMFCGCANEPHAGAPNANVCPVCMAEPGALPVVN